eukprot:scaffold6115_cov107-Skeletonema_menzelii.AAC.3
MTTRERYGSAMVNLNAGREMIINVEASISVTVWIGNIAWVATVDAFKAFLRNKRFSAFECNLPTLSNGRHRGFAFVVMQIPDARRAYYEIDGSFFFGRPLKVEMSKKHNPPHIIRGVLALPVGKFIQHTSALKPLLLDTDSLFAYPFLSARNESPLQSSSALVEAVAPPLASDRSLSSATPSSSSALVEAVAPPLASDRSLSSATPSSSTTVDVLNDDMSICSSESDESTYSNSSDPFLFQSIDDPVSFNAKTYYSIWKRGVENSGKMNELTEEQVINLLEAECFFCGRKHIPGENRVNSVDRIFSWLAVYATWNCISACNECNMMKLWLEHPELFYVIKQWNKEENLERIRSLCGIKSIDELDELAALESDGTCVNIQGSGGMSEMRKGLSILMEHPMTRAMIQKTVLDSCVFCGQSISWGIDRLDSNESYIQSLQNGNLHGCCTVCNVFKGSNDIKSVLIHIRRIHNNVTTDEWKNRARNANEELAKETLECPHSLSTTLTFGHDNRKPIRIDIDDIDIVSPSISILQKFQFAANFEDCRLRTISASIAEYRSSLESISSRHAREALGIDLDAFEIDSDTSQLLTKMEAQAKCLDKMISDREALVGKSSQGNHMSFKGTSFPSFPSNSKTAYKDSESDSDDDSLSSFFEQDASIKKIIVHNPNGDTVTRKVINRCKEYNLSDFCVKSLGVTPFHNNTTTRHCRVSERVNGELVQCPRKGLGPDYRRLCKRHFNILSDLDNAEDADWRKIYKGEYELSDFHVKSFEETPFHNNTLNRHCRVSERVNGELVQCLRAGAGRDYERLCIGHFNILSDLDNAEDADWRTPKSRVYKLSDFHVKSFEETPFHNNTTNRHCRVSERVNGELVQCLRAGAGRDYERLCMCHFNILSDLDNDEDADWRCRFVGRKSKKKK